MEQVSVHLYMKKAMYVLAFRNAEHDWLRRLLQDAMAERLQLMADHGMTKEKLEKCVKTEGHASRAGKGWSDS